MKMDEIELQLLVIDLGDSCVVKVEKGVLSGPDRERIDPIYNPLDANVRCWVDIDAGFVWKLDKPFTEIRAAVDALADGEKPVPRIEQIDTQYTYAIVTENESVGMWRKEYDALCQLAGTPLPIWTPRKGEWSRIQAWESFIECPERGETDSGKIEQVDAPVEIWRYTLRRA